MYLGWDKLTLANTKLVEIAVDLAGAPCRNDNSGKTVANLIDDIFKLHGVLQKGVAGS